MREAAAEFGVGLAQRLLGIDFQKSRDVDDDEEQVADLAFDFFRDLRLRAGACGVELGQLLAQFVEDLLDGGPIEAGSGGLSMRFAALRPKREAIAERFAAGPSARFRRSFSSALISSQRRFTSSDGLGVALGEDVRMAANQLAVDGFQRIGEYRSGLPPTPSARRRQLAAADRPSSSAKPSKSRASMASITS